MGTNYVKGQDLEQISFEQAVRLIAENGDAVSRMIASAAIASEEAALDAWLERECAVRNDEHYLLTA